MPHPWTCPKCALVNHPSARRCDCGFWLTDPEPPPLPFAGFWIRLLGDAIDGTIAVAFALPAWFLFDKPVLGASRFPGSDGWGLSQGIVLCLFLWNMTWLVWRTGQSIGRRIVGIAVTDAETGRPPGFLRALFRNLFASFISAIFYLGFLWLVVDRRKQTWHDRVFGTVVRYVEAGQGMPGGRAGRGRP